ncbi:MAG TPA: RluA family pseudouridine synthase [Casimicrobiaceae bacterium]|jgi:23S rRNA pseudouridine955/2504/2580 synthase
MNGLSKEEVTWVTVDDSAAGQRVDNFLRRLLKGVPKSHVYRILRSGEVRINKGRAGPERRLEAGDVVRLPPLRIPAAGARRVPPPARPFRVPVLYEDDALIAVDKPAGLAVHGGSGIAHGLIEELRAARPQARFLELAHRLDRDTSGVLLVAKSRAALLGLHAALRRGEIDKRYQVLVRGRWRDAMRVVRAPLHKFSTVSGERRVRVDEAGRASETVFRRLRTWPAHQPPMALLEAELKTGRTHQIRVHLAHIGFSLAGDEKYGDFAWNRALHAAALRRMFLHAHRMSLRHPVSGERLVLESQLPADLSAFLSTLDARVQPAV